MTLRANLLVGAACAVLLATTAPLARAQSVEVLLQEGLELRRQQRDAEALQRFMDAYNLSQSAQALAQVALAEQALGNFVEAEVHLQQALATQDPWINPRRPALQEALGQISAQLGTIEITGGVAGAQVFVNGVDRGTFPQAARIRARAGSAVIEIRANGYAAVQRTVMIMAGGIARESIQLVASGVQVQGQGGVYVQPAPQPIYSGGPGYRPQPQYAYESRPNMGLFWAGLPIFAVPWVITGISGLTSSNSDVNTWGWIPLIGPWAMLGYIDAWDFELLGTLLIISGILQAAGVVMMILGLATSREVRVRVALGDEPNAPELTVTPVASQHFAGAALTLSHF